ncbi:MAG: TIGR04283 family arsenosugar biosynthesis glycosyltransferase [Actinobacteria bacterium]|nr:TIGR04283 family arsenosugar biosynthesis glycosyltransferase [Actinomycetota bacterium]
MSIIIPVLNEAESLPDLLEHLGAVGAHEVIVADGGSTDGSIEIAGSGARTISSLPGGRARQMNAGAAAASGDILLFLHADSTLPERAVEMIETAMEDKRVVGGRFRVELDDPGAIFRVIGRLINARDAAFGGFTGDQAIFVRRRVFEEMGGYAEIPLMEDLDLARRLKRLGTLVRLPAKVVTSARRWKKRGVVRTILLMWCLRALYLMGASPSTLKRFYEDVR